MHKNVKYNFGMRNISNLVVNVVQKRRSEGGASDLSRFNYAISLCKIL